MAHRNITFVICDLLFTHRFGFFSSGRRRYLSLCQERKNHFSSTWIRSIMGIAWNQLASTALLFLEKYNSQTKDIVTAKIITSMPYQIPTGKHYQCLCGQYSTANTMANPNNQAEMTLKDDDSITTLPSANYNITPSSKVKEYVLKFQFQPKTTKHNSEVTMTHYTILHAITHYFPETIIYDNHGKTINEFSKV